MENDSKRSLTFYMILKEKIFCIYYLCIVYLYTSWWLLIQLIVPHKKAKLTSQSGNVALITGGGRGIGYETAYQLLKSGMTVVIVGIKDNQQEGVEKLSRQFKGRVKFLDCDLSSLENVRRLPAAFKALNLPLHLLINNAGIMFAPRKETEEGFESHWVINYLSHFLITHLLLGTLKQSASESNPSRIVNLGSCLHYPATINFDDIQGKNLYSAEAAYAQSKLAMVMFAATLNRKLKADNTPVIINSVHPAIAFSELYREIWWAKVIPILGKLLLKTPAMGSDTVVHAAISEEITTGGNYYENSKIELPSKEAQSSVSLERLWALSCSQVGIKEFGKETFT